MTCTGRRLVPIFVPARLRTSTPKIRTCGLPDAQSPGIVLPSVLVEHAAVGVPAVATALHKGNDRENGGLNFHGIQ